MSDPSVINDSQLEPDSAGKSTADRDKLRPWVRHYEQGVPAQLDIPDQPLTWLLDQTVSKYPGQTAIIYYGTKLSYAQLSSLANRFATGLQKLGIQKGDRVAVALPNIPQFPIAFFGALEAGAVVVPTNPLYTEREMQHQLADSGARGVVLLDAFYPVVRAVRAQTALEHIILTSPTDFLPPVLRALYPLKERHSKQPEPHLTHQELRRDQTLHVMQTLLESNGESKGEAPRSPVPIGADDLAVLQYTGGTTGLSKG